MSKMQIRIASFTALIVAVSGIAFFAHGYIGGNSQIQSRAGFYKGDYSMAGGGAWEPQSVN